MDSLEKPPHPPLQLFKSSLEKERAVWHRFTRLEKATRGIPTASPLTSVFAKRTSSDKQTFGRRVTQLADIRNALQEDWRLSETAADAATEYAGLCSNDLMGDVPVPDLRPDLVRVIIDSTETRLNLLNGIQGIYLDTPGFDDVARDETRAEPLTSSTLHKILVEDLLESVKDLLSHQRTLKVFWTQELRFLNDLACPVKRGSLLNPIDLMSRAESWKRVHSILCSSVHSLSSTTGEAMGFPHRSESESMLGDAVEGVVTKSRDVLACVSSISEFNLAARTSVFRRGKLRSWENLSSDMVASVAGTRDYLDTSLGATRDNHSFISNLYRAQFGYADYEVEDKTKRSVVHVSALANSEVSRWEALLVRLHRSKDFLVGVLWKATRDIPAWLLPLSPFAVAHVHGRSTINVKAEASSDLLIAYAQGIERNISPNVIEFLSSVQGLSRHLERVRGLWACEEAVAIRNMNPSL